MLETNNSIIIVDDKERDLHYLGSRGNVRGWEHTLLAKYLD